MELQEKRLRVLSEILQGILVVKLFGWESAMKKRVEDLRQQELKGIRQWNYSIATIMCIVTGLSTLLSASTFAVYTLLGMFVIFSLLLFPLRLTISFPLTTFQAIPCRLRCSFLRCTSSASYCGRCWTFPGVCLTWQRHARRCRDCGRSWQWRNCHPFLFFPPILPLA